MGRPHYGSGKSARTVEDVNASRAAMPAMSLPTARPHARHGPRRCRPYAWARARMNGSHAALTQGTGGTGCHSRHGHQRAAGGL